MKWKVGTLDQINLIMLVALLTMVSLLGIFTFDLSQRTTALQVRLETVSPPKEAPLPHPSTSSKRSPTPIDIMVVQSLAPAALSQLATFPHLLPMALASVALYQMVD